MNESGNVLGLLVKLDMDTSMVGGPEHPVVRIEVLVHRDLEHSGGTLTRHGIKQLMYAEDKKGHPPTCDSRPGQEECPSPEPFITIFCDDRVLVGQPVQIPPPDRGRIVDPKHVDGFDLKVSLLELWMMQLGT